MRNNSRENFCLLNVIKSMHSKTCLPENVCKFLFDCYAYAYVASDSMVVDVRMLKKLCKYKMYPGNNIFTESVFLLRDNGMDQLSAAINSTKSNKQRLSQQNS
ncbi:hypothetical protein T10_11916 [Trichinella papuae]|uniref:Uncharacterized protein n=1 Tax=Trichinella papuae TaxID=268474 RepID=A0A0V1MAW6_9BILA|nr:hypothetical protein T10_11916 [Trichinella papuae]